MKMILLSALATLALISTGCQQDEFGDQNPVSGKPGYLTLKIGGSKVKTKAMQQGGYDANAERTINDFTVFIYRADGTTLDVPAYYSTAFDNTAGSTTVSIPITMDAAKVMVVANMGDPTGSGTLLSGLLDLNGGIDFTKTLDLQTANQATGSLIQTGEEFLTWNYTNASASATIDLKFVAARVSLENVTLFGQPVTSLTGDGSTQEQLEAGLTSNHTITINQVYVLNAAQTTYLFSNETRNGNIYTGNPYPTALYDGVAGFGTWLTGKYEPQIPGVTTTTVNSALAESAISSPIDASNYPYFYVWENADNGNTHGGVTLLIIECTVDDALNSTQRTVYYTVPLDPAANNGAAFSIKRNTHYHISVDIKSLGKVTPYVAGGTAVITINTSTWEDTDGSSNPYEL